MNRSAFLGGMKVNPRQTEASIEFVILQLAWMSAEFEAQEEGREFVILDSLQADGMKMHHAFGKLATACAYTTADLLNFKLAVEKEIPTIKSKHEMSSRKGRNRNKYWLGR